MKTKVSPTIVGLFVIVAIALGVVALLSFGGVHFFYEPQRFVVNFNETIQGLDLGSPVKLRGVHIGRVVDLSVRYDGRNAAVVRVVCEFSRSRIFDNAGNPVDVADRESMKKMIDQGLRAHLGIQGLATGLLYVELEFADPKESPPPANQDGQYLLMPSVPSSIAELQANVDQVVSSLARVDFPKIADDVKGLIDDARGQLRDLNIKGVVDQWTRTGATIDALASDRQLKTAIQNISDIAESARSLLASAQTQLTANGSELQKTLADAQVTLKSFNEAAQTIDKFVQNQRGLGEDVAASLRQLSDAALAVQRLAEFLERNPNSLILGRKAAPAK